MKYKILIMIMTLAMAFKLMANEEIISALNHRHEEFRNYQQSSELKDFK